MRAVLSTEFWRVDRVGIERFEQLAAVLFELLESFRGCLSRLSGIGQQDAHVIRDERTDCAGLLLAERDSLPMRGHQVFKVGRLDSAEGAAVLEYHSPKCAPCLPDDVGQVWHAAYALIHLERDSSHICSNSCKMASEYAWRKQR